MSLRKIAPSLVLLVTALCYMTPASAGLMGTVVNQCADSAYSGTVTADVNDCRPSTAQPVPETATIDDSVEFSLTNSGTRTFDFSDSLLSIYYENVSSPSPDLYIFDFEMDIVDINVLTSNLGVTATFVDNHLGVLISSPLQTGWAYIEITTSAVSEPAAIALMLVGLAGIAVSRKRKA